ncbi:hypothetical protein HPY42_05360 [Coprothermobacteraceae bacterium]|nr:hypothetical protein [Coprothermobacteraceae bacterium]
MAEQIKKALDELIMQAHTVNAKREAVKEKVLQGLQEMSRAYDGLSIPKGYEKQEKAIVEFIEKRCKEAQAGFQSDKEEKEFWEKMQVLNRYLKASILDFTDKSKSLRYLHLSFIASSVIFYATWPLMVNNFVVPLLFFLPTFLAVMGLKNRSRSALPLMVLAFAIQLLNGAMWTRYAMTVVMGQAAAPGHWFYLLITILGVLQIPVAAFSATLAYMLKDALV